MKVSALTLDQIDYWVAKAQSIELTAAPDGNGYLYIPHPTMAPRKWSPTRLWSQGGPLIEETKIDLNWDWEASSEWTASIEPDINTQGKTVLETAMKALITAKFGEEVEL